MNEIILETSAIFISLFCLYDCLHTRRQEYIPVPKTWGERIRDQHFVYFVLLITTMISAFASVFEVAMENYFPYKNAFALITLNQIYFIFHTVLAFMFALYILDITGAGKEKKALFYVIFLTPFFISEVLVLINPFTHLIYDISDDLQYVRGEYFWILYASGAFYFLMGFVFYFAYKNRMSKMDRSATLLLIVIAILGVAIQGIWFITVELFFEATGLLGFLLLLESRHTKDKKVRSSRLNKNFIVVISMIFLTVVAININLIYHVGSDQTGRIGNIQIDNIKGNFQETISGAESNLLRFSLGMEQLMSNPSEVMREIYIRQQKRYYIDLTDGNCFNVYAASPEWTIIPDFDMPEHYHAVERVWYTGAKQNPSQVYISEPYIDAATGDLCFTLSNLLSDGETVVAMDFTLSKVQEVVRQMSRYEEQTALVVTKEGTIVGCSDMTKQGMSMKEALPEYMDIFERVRASKEHQSFTTIVDGRSRIVFCNETSNGWQLILIVDSDAFYSDIYRQMIMVGTIDLLMVVVIVVFYLVSINSQEKAETTLASAENFIRSLTNDLTIPVNEIINTSDRMLSEGAGASTESIRDIRETGKRLHQMMDNLLSYSSIMKADSSKTEEEDLKKGSRKLSLSSRLIRNGIVAILFVSLSIGLIMCLSTSKKWGETRISSEADKYDAQLSTWIVRNQSILRMFTDVISTSPEVLDDYESAVKWLDSIGRNYSELSYCYIANPYWEGHRVIMNNGWDPGDEYKPEERPWYIETERSGDGFSISLPYYDVQTGNYCITFSRAVYSSGGDFLGIFAIDCYVDKLIEILSDSYSNYGYAFLVDRDGNIINHPAKEYEMSADNCVNIEDTIYADAFYNGEVFGMRDYNGNYVSCRAKKSETSDFTVVVIQSFWGVYGNVVLMALAFVIVLFISIGSVVALINRFIEWQEETNERLVKAADAAVSAGKAKSRFLAQMSHEIRTPINAVLGMNEMILRESEDDSIREYSENIQTAGKNLLGLINSILDFSKIEEGKMEIIPVKYKTASMMNNLIHSVDQRAEDKGLVFEAHIDENIPSSLYGDDMRVSQVVINLLTNAVKYTAEGRVDMFVSGKKQEDGSFSLGFRVKDTGMGIKEEDLGKLFESFTRLDETRNRNIEGTGLGMAIVTKLLDMMGSKLEVKSKYGEGSEFSFEVLQKIEDEEPIGDFRQKAREDAENHGEETYVYAPKARLLAVDDNSMNLKVIKNLLKQNGIVPDMAESGEAALKLMAAGTYHMVLLDHMMPKMDGIETLKKAREDNLVPENTTVIALTANAVVGARESYLAAGFDDYLSKPVEVKALEEALVKYLPKEIVEIRVKAEHHHGRQPEKKEEAPASKRLGTAPKKETEALEFSPSGGKEVLEFSPSGKEEVLEFGPSGENEGAGDGSKNITLADIEKELNDNGIVTQDGMGYCGGDEGFYLEILSDYVASLDERTAELNEAFRANDLEMYAIKVHALKSTAKTVGDRQVSGMAADLEAAAKEHNKDAVSAGHGPLTEAYKKHASIIDGIINVF